MRARRIVVLAALAALLAGCGPDAPPPPDVDVTALPDEIRRAVVERLRAIEAAPTDAGLRAELGLALEANALPEPAAASFADAAALDPAEPRFRYHLARVLETQGRIDEALTLLDGVILDRPTYGPARRLRGEWLLALGRLAEADTAFRTAVRVTPNDVGPRVGLARTALQRGDSEQALEILAPLVEREPDAGFLWRLIADAHRQAGRLDEAGAALARAIQDDPPLWPDPWTAERERYHVGFAASLKRAMRLVKAGRLDQAISLMESLRDERPDDVTLLTNLGAAYVDARRLQDGVATLRDALRVEPEHFGANLNLAAAFERARRFDDALVHVDRAIAANPGLGDAHLMRGRILVGRRELDDALDAFDRAHRAAPRRTQPLVLAGWVRAERGEWPLALGLFRDAAELEATDGSAQLGLALALAESGDLAGAERALAAATTLAPNQPQMPIVRRRLAQLRGPR